MAPQKPEKKPKLLHGSLHKLLQTAKLQPLTLFVERVARLFSFILGAETNCGIGVRYVALIAALFLFRSHSLSSTLDAGTKFGIGVGYVALIAALLGAMQQK